MENEKNEKIRKNSAVRNIDEQCFGQLHDMAMACRRVGLHLRPLWDLTSAATAHDRRKENGRQPKSQVDPTETAKRTMLPSFPESWATRNAQKELEAHRNKWGASFGNVASQRRVQSADDTGAPPDASKVEE